MKALIGKNIKLKIDSNNYEPVAGVDLNIMKREKIELGKQGLGPKLSSPKNSKSVKFS